MLANSMRSFAGGLIVAASVCGGVYFFGPNETPSTQTVEKPSENEMKRLLISDGYIIHTEEEWQKQLAAIEAAEMVDPVENNTNEQATETIIYRTMLTVTPGMTSIDVGKALERANIIDKGIDFYKAVEKKGLSTALLPGTYEVESGKTMDEIISTIFK